MSGGICKLVIVLQHMCALPISFGAVQLHTEPAHGLTHQRPYPCLQIKHHTDMSSLTAITSHMYVHNRWGHIPHPCCFETGFAGVLTLMPCHPLSHNASNFPVLTAQASMSLAGRYLLFLMALQHHSCQGPPPALQRKCNSVPHNEVRVSKPWAAHAR